MRDRLLVTATAVAVVASLALPWAEGITYSPLDPAPDESAFTVLATARSTALVVLAVLAAVAAWLRPARAPRLGVGAAAALVALVVGEVDGSVVRPLSEATRRANEYPVEAPDVWGLWVTLVAAASLLAATVWRARAGRAGRLLAAVSLGLGAASLALPWGDSGLIQIFGTVDGNGDESEIEFLSTGWTQLGAERGALGLGLVLLVLGSARARLLAPAAALLLGVGAWRLLDPVGVLDTGGFGTVYEQRSATIGVTVVLVAGACAGVSTALSWRTCRDQP